MRIPTWQILILAASLLSASALVLDAQETHSWGYSGEHGPDHWSEVSATCGLGKTQSPIDMRRAAASCAMARHMN